VSNEFYEHIAQFLLVVVKSPPCFKLKRFPLQVGKVEKLVEMLANFGPNVNIKAPNVKLNTQFAPLNAQIRPEMQPVAARGNGASC